MTAHSLPSFSVIASEILVVNQPRIQHGRLSNEPLPFGISSALALRTAAFADKNRDGRLTLQELGQHTAALHQLDWAVSNAQYQANPTQQQSLLQELSKQAFTASALMSCFSDLSIAEVGAITPQSLLLAAAKDGNVNWLDMRDVPGLV